MLHLYFQHVLDGQGKGIGVIVSIKSVQSHFWLVQVKSITGALVIQVKCGQEIRKESRSANWFILEFSL